MPRHIGTCFRFYTQMRVEKKHKAFAYRVPIGDYNYLQCETALGPTKNISSHCELHKEEAGVEMKRQCVITLQ